MGLFDVPAPVFDALDAALSAIALPAALRVVLYAAACAWLSMSLYRRWSDQDRMLAVRAEIARTQALIAAHEGEFRELNHLVLKNLRLTLRQLGMTLRPTLLASLPLLSILPWLSNAFTYTSPSGPVHVCAEPQQNAPALHWQPETPAPSGGCWDITLPAVVDAVHTRLAKLPAFPKSEVVHKFAALNTLIGNPNGYLADDAPVTRLTLALSARELLPFGPLALRGWEPLFFVILMGASLFLKRRWRVI